MAEANRSVAQLIELSDQNHTVQFKETDFSENIELITSAPFMRVKIAQDNRIDVVSMQQIFTLPVHVRQYEKYLDGHIHSDFFLTYLMPYIIRKFRLIDLSRAQCRTIADQLALLCDSPSSAKFEQMRAFKLQHRNDKNLLDAFDTIDQSKFEVDCSQHLHRILEYSNLFWSMFKLASVNHYTFLTSRQRTVGKPILALYLSAFREDDYFKWLAERLYFEQTILQSKDNAANRVEYLVLHFGQPQEHSNVPVLGGKSDIFRTLYEVRKIVNEVHELFSSYVASLSAYFNHIHASILTGEESVEKFNRKNFYLWLEHIGKANELYQPKNEYDHLVTILLRCINGKYKVKIHGCSNFTFSFKDFDKPNRQKRRSEVREEDTGRLTEEVVELKKQVALLQERLSDK